MTSVDTTTGEILPSLAECEQIIERGLGTFVEVGEALLTIRDARLYRETHPTFEAYCSERWSMTRGRAYQLIAAAAMSTTVDIQNEAQARELVGLDPETAQTVFDVALGFAKLMRDSDSPTAGELKTARVHVTVGPRDKPTPATREEAQALTEAIRAAAAEVLSGGDEPPPSRLSKLDGRREADAPAAPPSSPVDDFLNGDADVQGSVLKNTFDKLITSGRLGLPKLNALQVAAVVDDSDVDRLHDLRDLLDRWIRSVEYARKNPNNLRSVAGGR